VISVEIVPAMCSTVMSDSKGTPGSSQSKEERLWRRREQERASRAAKTADEKEQRLRQHRERDRARHTAQSIEKREARSRLDRLRAANNLYCVMADWCGVTSCM